MGIGWGIAYQVYFFLLDPLQSRIKHQILFFGIFASSWLGAKLLFSLTNLKSTEILQSLDFWIGGGFVFYGGLIGGIIFLLFYILFDKALISPMVSSILPALTLGHAVGRLGCFLAGCCYGKPTNLIWGVYMHGHYRHPTQLIEAAALAGLSVYFFKKRAFIIWPISIYLMSYGALRVFIELLRDDGVRGLWGPLPPSLWISFGLILGGVILIYINKIKSLRLRPPN